MLIVDQYMINIKNYICIQVFKSNLVFDYYMFNIN